VFAVLRIGIAWVQAQKKKEEVLKSQQQDTIEKQTKLKTDTNSLTNTTVNTEYFSVDPAPALQEVEGKEETLESLGMKLQDQSLSLFQRYAALFTLRNKGTAAAADVIATSALCDESSALLRHEVAYVLGQMQVSTPIVLSLLTKVTLLIFFLNIF